jgi:hypothetical protein
MDEQKLAGIGFESERDFLLKASWSLTAPSRIGVDDIHSDTSAMRSEQPLKNGDQHLAIRWPVCHQRGAECSHSGSSPK